MVRRKRQSRKQRKPEPVQALAVDEVGILVARHPASLIQQLYALTENLPEPTHRLTFVSGPPGTDLVGAILFPLIWVTDGD